ncbi:type VI secretion system ATPase TssH, partial [Pseudomonas sp. MAFF 311095]
MMNVDLQQLIQTLTPRARRDLERSAERCVTRGGREVLVEDLLLTLLEHHDGLLARALADAGLDAGELQAALQPKGESSASRNPVFAQALVRWLQQALMVAHLELRQTEIDHGALLLALLRHPLEHAGSA